MLYPTDESRITFVCSLLTGRALDWATAVWSEVRPTFPSFRAFIQRFKEVFEHPAGGKEVGEQLLSLRQGRGSAADYALSFRTLAVQTGGPDDPLKLNYHKGLNTELQSELACHDEGKSLEQYIELSIKIDNLLRCRHPNRLPAFPVVPSAANSDVEPMQIGLTRISEEERERDAFDRVYDCIADCLDILTSCPTRPSRNPVAMSVISKSATSLEIAVTLEINGKVIETVALIDSGAAGNLNCVIRKK